MLNIGVLAIPEGRRWAEPAPELLESILDIQSVKWFCERKGAIMSIHRIWAAVLSLLLLIGQSARGAATHPATTPPEAEAARATALDDSLPEGCRVGTTLAAQSASGLIAVCWTRTVDSDEYELTENGRRALSNAAALDTTPDMWRHKESGRLLKRIPRDEEFVPPEERLSLALIRDGRLFKRCRIPIADGSFPELADMCWTGDDLAIAVRSKSFGPLTIHRYYSHDDRWTPRQDASAISCGSEVWLLQGRAPGDLAVIEERYYVDPGPMAWIAQSRQQVLSYTDPSKSGRLMSEAPVTAEMGIAEYQPFRLPNGARALTGTRTIGGLVSPQTFPQPA